MDVDLKGKLDCSAELKTFILGETKMTHGKNISVHFLNLLCIL